LKAGVADDLPPSGMREGGEIVGYDVDMLKLAESASGGDLRFEISSLSFDNAMPALKSGRVDLSLVGGYAESDARRAEAILVDYVEIGFGLLVKKGNPHGVGNTLASLCGLKVSTFSVSDYTQAPLREQSKKCEADGKPPVELVLFPDASAQYLAVKTGRVHAYFDASALQGYQAKLSGDFDVLLVPDSDMPKYIGSIAFAKKAPEIARQVCSALNAAGEKALTDVLLKWGLVAENVRWPVTINETETC
jgi:ABC-type amino acid transport/signal transduction systems, periplasmic component/domain